MTSRCRAAVLALTCSAILGLGPPLSRAADRDGTRVQGARCMSPIASSSHGRARFDALCTEEGESPAARARRTRDAADAVARAMNESGFAVAAPVLAAASSDESPPRVAEEPRIVTIDGRRWRRAPPGTPENGPPGSRIILDGQVYLDADDPDAVFAPPATVTSLDERRDPDTDEPVPSETSSSVAGSSVAGDSILAEEDAVGFSPEPLTEPRTEPVVEPLVEPRTERPAGTFVREESAEPRPGALDSTVVPAVPDRSFTQGQRPDVETATESAAVISSVAAALEDGEALAPMEVRDREREFDHIDVLLSGGGDGDGRVRLEGSLSFLDRFFGLGRLGASTDARALRLAVGWYPASASTTGATLVLTAGVETAYRESSDTGAHVGAALRLALGRRFELQVGVEHGSLFDGDLTAFGVGLYRVGPRWSITSRIGSGEVERLGIGARYHY